MAKRTDEWGEEMPSKPYPLDYGRPRGREPKGSFAVQAAAGFACWFMVDWLLIGVGLATKFNGSGELIFSSLAIALALLVWVAIYLRMRRGNRGFLPGLLIGIGLTCVLPMVALWAICGPPGGRPF